MMDCKCGRIKVGGRPTGSLNWNPDCRKHRWTPEMREQNHRAVLMQALAGACRWAAERDRQAQADTL